MTGNHSFLYQSARLLYPVARLLWQNPDNEFACHGYGDVQRVLAGLKKVSFYLSESNIVLSPGIGEKGTIPPKYIRQMIDLKTWKIIFEAPFDYICCWSVRTTEESGYDVKD